MRRYNNIPIIKSPDGKRIYKNVRYPEIPRSFDDIYVYTTIGDRFDTLAQQYYDDSSLWWIIASANNQGRDSLVVKPGIQLRIPMNTSNAINLFNALNANR